MKDRVLRSPEGGDGGGAVDPGAGSVEIAALKAKVDEFRKNNIELQKRLTAFGDLTPESIAELLKLKENVDKSDEAKQIAQGKIDDVIQQRIAKVVARHETEKNEMTGRVKALETERDNLKKRLEETLIDNAVIEHSRERVRPGLVEAVKMQARQRVSIDPETGGFLFLEGGKEMMGNDGKAITDFPGFISSLPDDYFKASTGGGAAGGARHGRQTFTKDDAAAGKVSLEKIASGETTLRST